MVRINEVVSAQSSHEQEVQFVRDFIASGELFRKHQLRTEDAANNSCSEQVEKALNELTFLK